MKKFFLLFCLCTVVIIPQSLRQVTSQSYNSLSGVFFLDENVGWASGSYESIYKTTDAGNTWTLLAENPDVSSSFSCIQFFDANTGFAGGGLSSSAKFAKTTDGGSTWTELTSPDAFPIQKLYFADLNTGWVLTSSSTAANILKTTDGGNSWTNVLTHTAGDLEDLYILPSGKGVAVGGGVGKIDLFYSADGTTWTKAPAPTIPPGVTYTRTDIRGVYMVNDNLVYTCGWGSSAAGLQPNLFLKSTDGGATWTYLQQAPENRIYTNLNSIVFKDELNGLAFGGGAYEGTVIARTTDGGINWIPVTSGTGFTAQDGINIGNKVWVVGAGGSISYSENFGDTWSLKTPIVGSTIYDIVSVNNSIFAGGYSGVIIRSTDKGVNWTSHYAAIDRVCNSINGMYFLDETKGFAARNNRLVCKTTDAGLNWTKIINDTNATGMVTEAVYFLDDNNGYVAGRVASNVDAIYKTINGGIDWTITTNIASENLNDIDFADANSGAAAANDSKILYTTDGGTSWQVSQFVDLPAGLQVDIKKLTFTSATKGVAVGEKCIFTTDDAGATWKYIVLSNLDKTLEGVAFKNENEGWAVGSKLILSTVDGGKTWTDVSDTVVTGKYNLYAVSVDMDGYLWIGGGESTIFTNAPFVSVNDELPVVNGFSLEQNYPNPFNPSTVINYKIASESRVTIRVYDVLGSMFKELVNRNLPAGDYSVNFNAAGISSGVYFYVMNAGGNIISRKMTILK